MKSKLPRKLMEQVATYWKTILAPNCHRIEIAGSLRRCKESIGDIELIVVPKTALYQQLDEMLAEGTIRPAEPKRWGQKQRVFMVEIGRVNGVPIDESVQVDVYLQPDPATWGVNLLLRTGSWEFSRNMVTRRSEGGFMPDHYRVEDARVKAGATLLDTPEEEDVFRLWGFDYVLPPQRTEWFQPKFGPVPEIEWQPEPAQASLF